MMKAESAPISETEEEMQQIRAELTKYDIADIWNGILLADGTRPWPYNIPDYYYYHISFDVCSPLAMTHLYIG